MDTNLSKEDFVINSDHFNDELSPSNIIGTHPTEVITSINPDNGYPVRQENGQRKSGPPPGKAALISIVCGHCFGFRLANDSSSTWSRL